MTKTYLRPFVGALAVAVLSLGLLGVSQGASAAIVDPCSTPGYTPDATNKLTANDGCALLTGSSSAPKAADLVGLFGQTDWTSIAKIDSGATGSAPGNTVNGFTFASGNGNESGTWAVSQAIYDAWSYVAIVMNDGNQNPAPTIMYLVSDLSGTWSTPWFNPNAGKNGKYVNSLSHADLFVSGPKVIPLPTAAIPLPAAAWLMLAGIGGLGVVSRRRKEAA